MRIRRGLLFWGLFLIPLGAVPLLVRAGAVDAASLAGAWRLWPVILIALGLALVAGRSQVAVVGTAVTAIILGIAAGGALASGNNWLALLGDCSARSSNAAASIDQSGSFVSPATVRLGLNCGDILLSTQRGTDWTFRAEFSGPPPLVNGSADRLEINSSSGGGGRHQAWDLKLPSLGLGAIDLTANAGSGTLDLAGTTLDSLTAKNNAFDLSVDASDATLKQLDIGMNAGRTRITLGAGSMTGKLSVNAGAIDLCVPADAQLRIRLTDSITFAHNLDDRGLVQDGETWTRSGGNLNSTIELTVSGAAASFTLDPDGGCQ